MELRYVLYRLQIARLQAFLAGGFPFTTGVTIADNGSTDGAWDTALELAVELPGGTAIRLEQPGRGRELRSSWSQSGADDLAYMDVNLSTDLNALLPLVAPLLSGHNDIAKAGSSRRAPTGGGLGR